MSWVWRFSHWLGGPAAGARRDADVWARTARQTRGFILILFAIAFFAVAALIIAGLPGGPVKSPIWALIGAIASAIAGSALGLLFGLPTVESKRTIVVSTQTPPGPLAPSLSVSPAGSAATEAESASHSAQQTVTDVQEDLDTGYRDSTSLEHIADWLTKIIVGLTLTQFTSWRDQFAGLASNLTAAMLGASSRDPICARLLAGQSGTELLKTLDLPLCRPSPIPGGFIIGFFAMTGFLATYLWMRRYFILEMVIAKVEAKNELKEKAAVSENKVRKTEHLRFADEQREIIDAAGVAGLAEVSGSRQALKDPGTELGQILDRATKRLIVGSPAARTLAAIRTKVEKQATDPDDPWRGKFGPQLANGFSLEASVSPIAGNPQFFRVDLLVRAQSPGLADEAVGSRVMYFLHPTFRDQPRISNFGVDGTAPLELFAYGAFTVGVLLLENGTVLELNLATVPDAPQRFLTQ